MEYLIFEIFNENNETDNNIILNNIINDIILRYKIKQKIIPDNFKQVNKLSFILLDSELNQQIIHLERNTKHLKLVNYINQIILLKSSKNINNIINYLSLNDKTKINFDVYNYNLNIVNKIISNTSNKELMIDLKNNIIKSSEDVINYSILKSNIKKGENIKTLLFIKNDGFDYPDFINIIADSIYDLINRNDMLYIEKYKANFQSDLSNLNSFIMNYCNLTQIKRIINFINNDKQLNILKELYCVKNNKQQIDKTNINDFLIHFELYDYTKNNNLINTVYLKNNIDENFDISEYFKNI